MENENEGEIVRGTGAIKDTLDERDYKFSDIARSLAPFNWGKGYDIEEIIGRKIKVKDQGNSSSCGGQAWAYYGEVLDPDFEEKSAKFLYAQTFVKGGGSAGRTNCELVIKKGWGNETLTLSYENGQPPSELFMEDVASISNKAFLEALTDKGLSYANVNIDIDSIALAIRENKGCIIGITGKNNGTWTSKFPLPPDIINSNCWNHWLYFGKAKIINGKKYIGFINSWGVLVGEKGWQWISEDYSKYPFIWSTWTMCYNFPKPPTNFQFTRNMKLFSRLSPDVKELQKRLNMPTIFQTGYFFTLTKAAVIVYQKSHGLSADGIVGPLTRASLNA